MSTHLEPGKLVHADFLSRTQAGRIAVWAPLLLALPWLLLCRIVAMPTDLATLRGLLLVVLLLSATVTDLLWRRIYNATTYTIFGWVVGLELAGTLMNGVSQDGASFSGAVVSALGALPWRDSLAGFAAGFGIMFVLYNLFRGGAGDLKLVAVLGALVGIHALIEILIYSYLVAGAFAACLVVGTAGPGSLLAFAARTLGFSGACTSSSAQVSNCLKRHVPMAPFIAGGTLLALVLR